MQLDYREAMLRILLSFIVSKIRWIVYDNYIIQKKFSKNFLNYHILNGLTDEETFIDNEGDISQNASRADQFRVDEYGDMQYMWEYR